MKTLPTMSPISNLLSDKELNMLNKAKHEMIRARPQELFNALVFNKIKAKPQWITNML